MWVWVGRWGGGWWVDESRGHLYEDDGDYEDEMTRVR